MADQQSRGGKKEGARAPGQTRKHQSVHGAETDRPAKGQAGGPKPSVGKTRHPHSKG